MCSFKSIYNAATGEDIETPRQLRALVGEKLLPACEDPADEDCCLCPVDVEGILVAAGFDFETDLGVGFVIHMWRP